MADEIMEGKGLEHKRNRGEEEWIKIKDMYPLIRERTDSRGVKMSLFYEIDHDPPEIAQLLAFTVDYEKHEIDKLVDEIRIGFRQAQIHVVNSAAKELGYVLNEDTMLGDLLGEDFIKLLVHFLADEQYPELQLHAATIIRPVVEHSPNRELVKKYITPSIVVNLVSSKVHDLQLEAILLLRTIVLGIPHHPQIKTIIEESFLPLMSIFNGPVIHESFRIASMTLAAICQIHTHLPPGQFKLAVDAFMRLINYEGEEFQMEAVVSDACLGLTYLCDGKEAVIVERHDFEPLIDRLIVLIDSCYYFCIKRGLLTLGSIVRWASDDYIELMIKDDLLYSLECLLREENMYYLMDTCWILSNITARKESYVEDVIRCECIDSLVNGV